MKANKARGVGSWRRGGCAPLLGAVCFWAPRRVWVSPVCPLAWSLGEAEGGSGEGQSVSANIAFKVPGSTRDQEQDLGRMEAGHGQDMSPSHCTELGPGQGSHFLAALAVHASAPASSEHLQNLPFLFFLVVSVFSLYEPVASGSRKVQ